MIYDTKKKKKNDLQYHSHFDNYDSIYNYD